MPCCSPWPGIGSATSPSCGTRGGGPRSPNSVEDEGIDTAAASTDAGAASAPKDPPSLDAADAGLALRYLPEIAVIVAVHLAPDVLGEAIAAAGWALISSVVVLPEGKEPPADLPDNAVTLAAAELTSPAWAPRSGDMPRK